MDVHRTLGSIRHSDRDQVGTERSSSAKESSLNRLCVRRIIDVVMERRSDVVREDQGLQQRSEEAKVSREEARREESNSKETQTRSTDLRIPVPSLKRRRHWEHYCCFFEASHEQGESVEWDDHGR